MISSGDVKTNTISFNIGNDCVDPVLVLDQEGFTYLGNRILDAGEAHRVFLDVLGTMKRSLSPEVPA